VENRALIEMTKEERKVYNKIYRDKNKEKILNQQREYKYLNKDKIVEYRKNNSELNKLYCKRYYEKNKIKICSVKVKKLRENINLRLVHNLRCRLRELLEVRIRTTKFYDLIGTNVYQLKSHLESKFTDGMSWENYGEWHIDHITPCSSFDLTDPDQQRECFNYTNLQPLWAKDNLSKSNKLNFKL